MEELYKQRLRELYDAVNTGNGLEQAMIEARVLLGVTDCDLKRPEPNWDEAPDWAEWWAVDEDEMPYWYGKKPRLGFKNWEIVDGGNCLRQECIDLKGFDWKQTLTKRP